MMCPHVCSCACMCAHRPAFECILARLVRMRTELGIPNTPPLQRYKLRPKSIEARNSSEKVRAHGGLCGSNARAVALQTSRAAVCFQQGSMLAAVTCPTALQCTLQMCFQQHPMSI